MVEDLKKIIMRNKDYIKDITYKYTKDSDDSIQIIKEVIKNVYDERKNINIENNKIEISKLLLEEIEKYINTQGMVDFEYEDGYKSKVTVDGEEIEKLDLDKLLDILDLESKGILIFKYFKDLPEEDICKIFEIDIDEVNKREAAAVEQLKTNLKVEELNLLDCYIDKSQNSYEFDFENEVNSLFSDCESKERKKVKKTIVIATSTFLLLLGGMFYGFSNTRQQSSVVKEKDVKVSKSHEDAIDLIHEMANTIILADHTWGRIEVTPKTIEKAIKSAESIKGKEDRDYLTKELEKWSVGDFSNGVEVHNYVWDMLGGTVGRAQELDGHAIDEIVGTYFSEE